MREIESVHGGVGAEEGSAERSGSLVVLNDRLGIIAKAGTWLVGEFEEQRLLVVPKLRMEHTPAMMIAGGAGLMAIFHEFRIHRDGLEMPSGFVGGMWKMWSTGSPQLWNAGFVLGTPKFDIDSAVRGCAALIRAAS